MDFQSDKENTSDVLEFPDIKSIEMQASRGVVKLDGGNPSAADLQAFKRLINEADEHREAFERSVSCWGDANILTQVVLPSEDIGVLNSDNTITERGWLNTRYQLASICVGLLAIIAVLLTTNINRSASLIYTTSVGEQQAIVLPDDSTVLLNTNSQVQVDYSADSRRLTLLRGEAHFDVAHDAERPFEVFAAKGLVRAIGTAFTVYLRKVDVEVIVTEGVVEVDSIEPVVANVTVLDPAAARPSAHSDNAVAVQTGLASAIKVQAGNSLTYDQQLMEKVRVTVAHEIERQLSWRRGMLAFDDEPLEKVIEEISRYTELKIVIPERKARELKVGGLFKIGDTKALFDALREGFGIHHKVVSDDVVYLVSNENR